MNGFTVIGVILTGVLAILLWLAGLSRTLDYVGDNFAFSYGKSVVITVTAYLGVTIAILFGIGAVVS